MTDAYARYDKVVLLRSFNGVNKYAQIMNDSSVVLYFNKTISFD